MKLVLSRMDLLPKALSHSVVSKIPWKSKARLRLRVSTEV